MPSPRKTAPPQETQAPPCPWEIFDADWYAVTYMRRLNASEPSDPFAHYTRIGARRGASPNHFFDEIWYLSRYPEVRAAVARGEFASGFAHYCSNGHRDHDPHWLFNEALYRLRHPQVNDTMLAEAQLRNGYHHYLLIGQNQTVSGSYFFDPQMLVDATQIAEQPFSALLAAPWLGNLRLSPYFDPDWYLAAHPSVEDEIAAGWYGSALHHFLANPNPAQFVGSADFDEAFYAAHYPDIGDAIATGVTRTGYQHFIDHGRFEDRRPAPWFDPVVYRRNHLVANALASTPGLTAFDHYLHHGKRLGLPAIRAAFTQAPPRAHDAAADALATCRADLATARGSLSSLALKGAGADVLQAGLIRTLHEARTTLHVALRETSPAAVHNFRKRVKDHLYHARLLTPLWPVMMGPHAEAAEELAETLGLMNDIAVFRDALTALDVPAEERADAEVLARVRHDRLSLVALPLAARLFAGRPQDVAERWCAWWAIWRAEA